MITTVKGTTLTLTSEGPSGFSLQLKGDDDTSGRTKRINVLLSEENVHELMSMLAKGLGQNEEPETVLFKQMLKQAVKDALYEKVREDNERAYAMAMHPSHPLNRS